MVLIHARNQGSVNNASVQAMTGLHRVDVTELLSDLRDRGLLSQQSSGRWAHYQLAAELKKTYQENLTSKTLQENLT